MNAEERGWVLFIARSRQAQLGEVREKLGFVGNWGEQSPGGEVQPVQRPWG